MSGVLVGVLALVMCPVLVFGQVRPPAGTTPLYRLTYNGGDTPRYYVTADKAERNKLVSLGWNYMGIACYVYPTPWAYEPGDEVPGAGSTAEGGAAAPATLADVVGKWVYTCGSYRDILTVRPDGTVMGQFTSDKGRCTLEGTTMVFTWPNGWKNRYPATPSASDRTGIDYNPNGKTQTGRMVRETPVR